MLFCFAVLEVKQQADSQLAGSRTFGSQQRKSTEAKKYFANAKNTQQKPAKLPGKEKRTNTSENPTRGRPVSTSNVGSNQLKMELRHEIPSVLPSRLSTNSAVLSRYIPNLLKQVLSSGSQSDLKCHQKIRKRLANHRGSQPSIIWDIP